MSLNSSYFSALCLEAKSEMIFSTSLRVNVREVSWSSVCVVSRGTTWCSSQLSRRTTEVTDSSSLTTELYDSSQGDEAPIVNLASDCCYLSSSLTQSSTAYTSYYSFDSSFAGLVTTMAFWLFNRFISRFSNCFVVVPAAAAKLVAKLPSSLY